jgi:HPt (histidine-containing phosphotransfer) domain-containing protein
MSDHPRSRSSTRAVVDESVLETGVTRRVPPVVRTTSAPVLDREAVARLREWGPDEFQALIRTFLDEATVRVGGLRAAREKDDARSLARLAHSLKGSSANFGAPLLGVLCAEIEAAAVAEARTDLPRLVDEVIAEFDRVRAALTEELR